MRTCFMEAIPHLWQMEWSSLRVGQIIRKKTCLKWPSLPLSLDLDSYSRICKSPWVNDTSMPIGANHSHTITILLVFIGHLGRGKTVLSQCQRAALYHCLLGWLNAPLSLLKWAPPVGGRKRTRFSGCQWATLWRNNALSRPTSFLINEHQRWMSPHWQLCFDFATHKALLHIILGCSSVLP